MATTVINRLRLGRIAGSKMLMLGLLAVVLAVVVEAAEQTARIALRGDAPASYTVKQGDTLWDISGRFLEQPWMWPQVWQVNPQIKNPDLIYPGDVITLSYRDGKPVLSLNRDTDIGPAADSAPSATTTTATAPSSSASSTEVAATSPDTGGIRTIRLSPEIKRQSMLSPIPAIPLSKIFAFLSKNSVAESKSFEEAPYLLGEQQGRTVFTTGDKVYARGNWNSDLTTYDIVREGRRFEDPDDKRLARYVTGNRSLGVESITIGTATIISFNGDRAMMKIDTNEREARVGDRLIPRQKLTIDDSYMPVPPDFEVNAAIASVTAGTSMAGQYDTLVLNKGSSEGLKAGHVLVVQKPSVVVNDEIGKIGFAQRVRRSLGMSSGRTAEYPGEKVANVLIYRVYDHTSLGLVLNASQEISLNYRVVTP